MRPMPIGARALAADVQRSLDLSVHRLRRRGRGLLLTCVAALLLSGVAAAPALAGNCSVIGGITFCGDVFHGQRSDRACLINTGDWSDKIPQTCTPRGQWSKFQDVDGFYVPIGCYADLGNAYYVNSGWYKISDNIDALVHLECG